jgi:signal transduction histidine kinase
LERWPTIRLALLGGYILSSLLTFLNVWMTAQLMFSSIHDLQLATVLLFFAGGISVVLGYFLSATLSDRIRTLDDAAQTLAGGDLSARVAVKGRDEVAQLARSFNRMAERLQVADQRQREVDVLRRDLIAWVSHDLQTPLASIRAMVEALADGIVQDEDTEGRYLEATQREIRALSQLIDDLFQMAQLDAGGLPLDSEMNSLSDLLSDVLESFSVLAANQGILWKGGLIQS